MQYSVDCFATYAGYFLSGSFFADIHPYNSYIVAMHSDVLSDQFHPSGSGVLEVEGRGFDVDEGDMAMAVDDILLQDRESPSRSYPSPRDLIIGMSGRTDTIIAETRSSLVASERKSRALAPKICLHHNHGRREGISLPMFINPIKNPGNYKTLRHGPTVRYNPFSVKNDVGLFSATRSAIGS
jgi:hypothetical protein